MTPEALRARFEALWKQVASGTARFEALVRAYNEPGRAYHNLEHISQMLREFDGARTETQEPVAVELALWYHDAVYDSRAKDNEEKSAALAADDLQKGNVDAALIQRVTTLILATKHQHPPQSTDEKVLVDCDLAILGQPDTTFDAYERAIRIEYEWVPADVYRDGRTKVLQSFLQRPALFSLDFFRQRYETQARRNLERSIARLKTTKFFKDE